MEGQTAIDRLAVEFAQEARLAQGSVPARMEPGEETAWMEKAIFALVRLRELYLTIGYLRRLALSEGRDLATIEEATTAIRTARIAVAEAMTK